MICAYSMCDNTPVARVKLPTGWGMVCRQHYDLIALNSGMKACADAGLKTVEEKIEFCKARIGAQSAPSRKWKRELEAMQAAGADLSPAQLAAIGAREPGEDDEEINEPF